ncbi:peroxidase 27-like [Nicotiana tabacum]|uniref:Peroxidase n=2 Tax=Nicotiana TaxID=4085 RepID=A0A1S3YET7_TOBAC|nr:PREDICTED: peroxidase 27-like [Nicotiana sylvestris]XP_016450710.1 PREDICTED: peroxidase 27-like [Nicotiana tabacum]
MATSKFANCCFLISLIFFAFASNHANGKELKVGFYHKNCPHLELIVKEVIDDVISRVPSLAAPLLRMHFHDCFVRGCDGSVLLNSPTKQAEKNAIPNLSLRGFQIIDKVKTAVEKYCPGIVSCADIVALVARDVTVAVKGPFWEVETGRRDGRVSNITEALFNLIPPFANITSLKQGFLQRGLSVKDLVVLSGSHTIGISHCSSFNNRLYNFTGKGDTDPSLDPNYIKRLKMKCSPTDQNSIVEMDPGSVRTFDTSYYNLVAKRRGLFTSDSALLDDKETKGYLKEQALNHGSTFFKDFGESMVKMGRIQVLTGTQGEIRKVCTKIN